MVRNAPNRDNAYRFLDAMLSYPGMADAITRSAGYASTFIGAGETLTELEKQAFLLTPDQLKRIRFASYKAQKLNSTLIDRAVQEVQAG